MKERALKKDEWLFKDKEKDSSLYRVKSGKILQFRIVGSKFIPLGELGPGNFIGEGSFFFNKEKLSFAIAMEDSTVELIFQENLDKDFPKWLRNIAISIAKKLEENVNIISERGIKRSNVSTVRPLTIEEQSYYLKLLKTNPTP